MDAIELHTLCHVVCLAVDNDPAAFAIIVLCDLLSSELRPPVLLRSFVVHCGVYVPISVENEWGGYTDNCTATDMVCEIGGARD